MFSVESHRRLLAEPDDPVRRLAADPVREHLLSGLALCGKCGEQLGVNSDGRTGRRMYRCPRVHLSRRLDLVDATVVEAVLSRVRDIGADELLVGVEAHDPAGAIALRRQIAELRHRTEQIARALHDGDISARDMNAVQRQARASMASLQVEYAHTLRAPALAALLAGTGRSRPDRSLSVAWGALTLQQRRDVITTLVEVTILPVGAGTQFSPSQLSLQWHGTQARH